MNTRNTRALVSLGDDSEDDEFRLLNSGKANRALDKAKAKATLQNVPAASPRSSPASGARARSSRDRQTPPRAQAYEEEQRNKRTEREGRVTLPDVPEERAVHSSEIEKTVWVAQLL